MAEDRNGVTVQDVSFEAIDGVTLRGLLHLPESPDGSLAPGVAMAHGFSATKEMGLPPFAERFAAAGMAVLLYDHRNLGASDGAPRQEINPWAQARDYRSALSWLGARPEVDPDRLAVWGSSFSGGEVLLVGACDDRVKAVVANVPFAGLPGTDYGADASDRFEAMRAAFLDESGTGLADPGGDTLGPMPVVTESDGETGFLAESESSEWFLDVGRRPGSTWRNEVTLRNAFGTEPSFDPGVCVAAVAPTPLLMVVATEDRVAATDVALAAFDRAEDPKHLVQIEGHHFAPYAGSGFEQAVGAATAFLAVVLEVDQLAGIEHLRDLGELDGAAGSDQPTALRTGPRRNRVGRSSSALAAAMLAVGEILEPERIVDETVQIQPATDDDNDGLDLHFGDLPPID